MTRDKRPPEIKFKPESYVELQYFSRIQVLNLNIKKQDRIIKELRTIIADLRIEEKREARIQNDVSKDFQHMKNRKDKTIEDNNKLRIQISEMISQKVNALKP